MSFNLNEWLKDTIETEVSAVKWYQTKRPRVFCKDGYSVSIQASEYHYCEPKYSQIPPKENGRWLIYNDNCFFGDDPREEFFSPDYIPYKTVELGYPSEADELINEFAEGDDYTNTVYAHVPVEVVEQLIEKHGGFLETRNVRNQEE